MIDANQGYDLVTARRLAKAVSDQNIRWFEEPMPISRVHD
jgi:L-alanine-DL-glutamate epimerase-like enolase superfamily enzyme